MVPALLLVGWTALLVPATYPFGSGFHLASLETRITDWSVGKAVTLLFATFVVALATHPLLFATTQLLEGYWGPSRLGVALAHRRALRHRRRAERLETAEEEASRSVDDSVEAAAAELVIQWERADFEHFRRGWLASPKGDVAFLEEWRRDAAGKAREAYPLEGNRSMPTRLGNALRRDEDKIGQQYGLSALSVAGHISLLAPTEQAGYVSDSRQQLDTAVRLSSMGLIATLMTFAWLITSGWLLTLALAPLAFAYLCYRGAVAAAQDYTHAVGVVLDLNRFALYNALRMKPPRTSGAEVAQNAQLMQMLMGRRVDVDYRES